MAPARQQPAPQFAKDEKVLCFHMDMLYEAKVMDVQVGEKPGDGYRYKVHYKGWKNTWDDWVLVDRIRPFDDEHKELAAQLHAQLKHSLQKNSKQPKKILKNGGDSARGSEERGSAAAQGGRGGRRGKDWELEQVRTLFFSLLSLFRLGQKFARTANAPMGCHLQVPSWGQCLRLKPDIASAKVSGLVDQDRADVLSGRQLYGSCKSQPPSWKLQE